jgi:hypothetical protein
VRAFRAKDRHISLGTESEYPQVIGAMDMIRMQVGNPDRVDVIDSGRYQLEPKLGWGINQQIPIG